MKYNHKAVEEKWQKIWEDKGVFHASDDTEKEKFYALIEFPYPSGQGLHVGHPRPYTALDTVARKRRLEGYNVLYPIGWDAFGLPTENYAIKNHIHPEIVTKKNIARSLNERGCEVTVYPADTPAEEVLAANPDGIMLSNGPGDPKENVEIIKEIKKMYDSNVPIFAICLGHQLMALANGMDTYKLKYGHRGGNHPVKDLETGRVYISSQNHGYAVDTNTVKPEIAVPAFVNVNDGTNEGLKYTGKNIFTVQYHPEACPGPQDSGYLFDRFLKMMEVND